MQFDQLGLSSAVLRAVSAAGYQTPTEIQALAIPPALSGGDVIGRAKTGSGKTAAFVLPILDRLEGGPRPARGVVRALVLTPTRELAQQVADSAKKYSRFLKLSSDAFYGGVSIEPQLKRIDRGLDILAATPGRLIDHLERRSIDLSRCEVLIVDEADRMFDMGFINDVKRIIKAIPKQRQTMLFSATMSKEVRRLTADIMNEPAFVEVGIEGNPAESVRQQFISVSKQSKLDLLYHLIETNKMESVLVFSRTKHGADKIAKRLMRSGIGTGVLHSNRSQSQRLRALGGFRRGEQRVLVATDIAARGIDVVGISHVINYDTPTFAEDYVHRIGRTGRAEATGDAITFVSNEEKAYLRRIESFVGKRYFVEPSPQITVVPDESATPVQWEESQMGVRADSSDSRDHRGGNRERGNGSRDRRDRNGSGRAPRKQGKRFDSSGGDTPRGYNQRNGKPKAAEGAREEAAPSDRPWKKDNKRNGRPQSSDERFGRKPDDRRSANPRSSDERTDRKSDDKRSANPRSSDERFDRKSDDKRNGKPRSNDGRFDRKAGDKRNGKPRSNDARFERRSDDKRNGANTREGANKRDDDRNFNAEGKNEARHEGATPIGGREARYGKRKNASFTDTPKGSGGSWKTDGKKTVNPRKPKPQSREWNFTERKVRRRDPRF